MNRPVVKGYALSAAIVFIALMMVSLVFVLPRLEFERADRKVFVVVDGRELARAIKATGTSWSEAASELQKVGVKGVGISRLTINELDNEGIIEILSSGAGTPFATDGQEAIFIRLNSRAKDYKIQWTLEQLVTVERRADVLKVFASGAHLRKARLFWDRKMANTLKKHKLKTVHRFYNHLFSGRELTPALLEGVEAGGLVLFDEKHALGWPSQLAEAAKLFNSRSLSVGLVEFAGQIGVKELIKIGPTRAIIVHSISDKEMAKFSIARFIPRWVRAVRERRVRAIYMRFFPPENPPPGKGDLFERNVQYFAKVIKSIGARGYTPGLPIDPRKAKLGPAKPLHAKIAKVVLILSLALASGLFLYLANILPLSLAIFLKGLGIAVFSALLFTKYELTVLKISALALGVMAPAIAVLLFVRLMSSIDETGWGHFLGSLIGSLLLVTTFCVSAGLGIHGLLCSPDFLMKLDQFSGVKLVYLAPLVLVTWVLLMDLRFRPERQAVTWLHVVLGLAVLGAGAVYLLRSGNFSPIPTSAAEHSVRDKMDMGLPVRPRTKEFLVGYPALLLLAFALRRKQREWSFLLAIGGTVACVSTVNSFCHLTCAPDINVARSFLGLLFGIPIGLLFLPFLWLLKLQQGRCALVVGYYGYGNAGDDVLLVRLLALLKEGLSQETEIVVLARASAKKTLAEELGVKVISRYNPFEIVPELLRCQLLVYGGGSQFQDRTGWLTLPYYSSFALAAQMLNVERRMFVAQGVGPISKPFMASLAAHVISSCDFIQVRDEKSAALLKSWGVEGIGDVGADLALWRRPEEDGPFPQRRARLGVALRPDKGLTKKRLKGLAEAVGQAALKRKERVQLLAFHPEFDKPLLDEFAKMLPKGVNSEYSEVTANNMLEVTASCRLVLCMRFHAALSALVTLTPFIGLSYDPKTKSLYEECGWPHWLDLKDLSADSLSKHFSSIKKEGSQIEKRLKECRGPMLRRGRLARERFDDYLC